MIDFIIYALAIAVAAYLLPGIDINSPLTLLITTLVLAIINAFIKPVLNFIALPLNVVTLGLFSLVINALLILLADSIVPGFKVESFWWALLFGVVLGIISGFLLKITRTRHLQT